MPLLCRQVMIIAKLQGRCRYEIRHDYHKETRLLCGKGRGKMHLGMSCLHFQGTLAMHDMTVKLACSKPLRCRQDIEVMPAGLEASMNKPA